MTTEPNNHLEGGGGIAFTGLHGTGTMSPWRCGQKSRLARFPSSSSSSATFVSFFLRLFFFFFFLCSDEESCGLV